MTAEHSASLRPRNVLLIVLAALLAIGGLLYVLADSTPSALTRRVEGARFQVLQGVGGVAATGTELREAGGNGQGVVAALVNDLPADLYRRVGFSAVGLDRATGAAVYWHRKSDPAVSYFRALSLEQVRRGEIELGPQDQWSGEIQTFGFVVQGPIEVPITITEVNFAELPADSLGR